jgi:hypothetical protein
VEAFSVRAAGRFVACALSLLSLGGGCAEGTQNEQLSEDTLRGPTEASGGSTSGSAGMPSAGDTAMPVAGMTNAAAGMSGVSGSETPGGGGAGGAAGTASGGMGGSGMAGGGAGGGMAGGGMGGIGGQAPTGFRYAKLVATSEQSGAVWSSCAELEIMGPGGTKLNRGGWTIVADSEETVDENTPAVAAIDGDTATFWHTAWAPAPNDVNDAKLPHSLTVDLVTTQPITGFSYLPRQTGTHGHVKDWEFYVSKNGVDWGTAVKKGTFPDVIALQTITF